MAFKMKGFSGFKAKEGKPSTSVTKNLLSNLENYEELAAEKATRDDTKRFSVSKESEENKREWNYEDPEFVRASEKADKVQAANRAESSESFVAGKTIAETQKAKVREWREGGRVGPRPTTPLTKKDPKVKAAKQNLKDVKKGVRADAKKARVATRAANKAERKTEAVKKKATKQADRVSKIAAKAQKKTDRVTGVTKAKRKEDASRKKDQKAKAKLQASIERNQKKTAKVVSKKKAKNDKLIIKQQNAKDKAAAKVKKLEKKMQP